MLGGRYRLVAPVGVGSSARVYLAVDTQLKRRVAVKLLHESLAEDEAFLRRFRAEARAAGALSHPNIVEVFDWGEDRDGDIVVPYLVTEYLGGGNLRGLLDSGAQLSEAQAVVVGLDAARALSHAHQRGLVHRDVKPGNLLFDDDGSLHLADFGLARALAEASWTEPNGIAVGTARYVSPEQALGRRLDGRSDVYSLALVLVECLTGEVPFVGDSTAATLGLRTQGDLRLGPELGGLRSVLERAGRLDPDERPEAAELEISLMAAAEELDRPAPLPIIPTLGDGENTSEMVVRHRDGVAVVDGELSIIEHPDPVVIGEEPDEPDNTGELPAVAPSAVSPSSADSEGRSPITVALEHELLAGSRPRSFGPVDPLVGTAEAPRKRRRWPVVAVVFVLLVAMVAGWWFVLRVPTNTVPNLVGINAEDANRIAVDLGWVVDDDTVDRRDGTDAGDVLEQSPVEGQSLAEGQTLVLVVSLGPTLTPMPKLEGLGRDEALAALAASGLAAGTVTEAHDESVAAGEVISAAPAPGGPGVEPDGRIARETAIDLTVSSGPAPRAVPSGLQGETRDKAVAALEAVQLSAAETQSYSSSVPAGYVISVGTSAGTELPRGAEVALEVSRGPAPVPVPDVRYNTGSMAVQTLEQQGFEVAGIEGSPSAMVVRTDPAPGELRPRGTAVRIYTQG